jgi:hypothetical protein
LFRDDAAGIEHSKTFRPNSHTTFAPLELDPFGTWWDLWS